jgi:hypothetical protein
MKNEGFELMGLRQLHDGMAALVASGDRPGIVTLISQGSDVQVDLEVDGAFQRHIAFR